MTRIATALATVTVLSALGCGGGSGSSFTISMTTLAGKVGGQPWSLVSGETDAFLSMNQPQFFTTMYTETVTPCTGAGFAVASNQIILNIPMTPGDYALSLNMSATFVVNPQDAMHIQNLIATQGRIVVDQITATTVTGGAHIQYDANNTVDGQFTATICAQ